MSDDPWLLSEMPYKCGHCGTPMFLIHKNNYHSEDICLYCQIPVTFEDEDPQEPLRYPMANITRVREISIEEYRKGTDVTFKYLAETRAFKLARLTNCQDCQAWISNTWIYVRGDKTWTVRLEFRCKCMYYRYAMIWSHREHREILKTLY